MEAALNQTEILRVASKLNFAACMLVTVFILGSIKRIEKNCQGEFRFLFHSFLCWLLAWGAWDVMWGLEAYFGAGDFTTTVLINLNTVFLALFCVGLIQGRKLRQAEYWVTLLELAGLLFITDVALKFFPVSAPLTRDFGRGWSLGLSMLSPVLIGWVVRLRYGSSMVLIAGLVYALAQPSAYRALFPPATATTALCAPGSMLLHPAAYEALFPGLSAQQVASECMDPNTVLAVIGVLALLKILFASAVLISLCPLPQISDSLVQSIPTGPSRRSILPSAVPLSMLGIGVVVASVLVLRQAGVGIAEAIEKVGTWNAALMIVLGALQKAGKILRKRAGVTDDN